MFVKYGKEYAAICRRRGNEEEAVYAEKEVEKVYQAVLDAGWDGEWFPACV
jgi:cellobiose phosphorylase